MMTCADLMRSIDAYLDDELSVMGVLRVHGHVRACEACRRALEAEASLHSLLAEDATRDQTPPTLRARILQRTGAEPHDERTAPGTVGRSRRRPLGSVWALAGATALVALLVLLPRFTNTGDGVVSPLAAELAVKHLLYSNRQALPLELRSSEPSAIARWLEPRLRLSLKLPRLDGSDQRLVGGRLSSLAERPAAYLLYEQDGRSISLFVSRPVPGSHRGALEQRIDGVDLYTTALHGVALAWWEDEEEGRLYAAASAGDPSGLRAFAVRCIRTVATDR